MKIFHSFVFILMLVISCLRPQHASAQIPVKAKAFLTMAGYGAAGGALLGMATMAFGNSSRAVAQGASLGLYAGIIFGSYVLISHHQKSRGSYDDNSSPYQESSDVYGDGYSNEDGGSNSSSGGGGFFDRIQIIQEQLHNQSFTFESVKQKSRIPPVHMNIIHYEF
jgi:hypothetical protein